MFRVMNQFHPAVECIFLLNRHFSNLPDLPTTLRADVDAILDKHNIPPTVFLPLTEPLMQMEAHILEGLSPMDPQVRHLFACSEGLFANLAWGLYFMEKEGVDFSCLSGETLTVELHHLLAIALNCSPSTLGAIQSLQDLAQFLDCHPASDTTKWACILFWQHPAKYQQLFRKTITQATTLFQEVASEATPLLEQFLPDITSLLNSSESGSLIRNVIAGNQSDIVVYPLLMRCQGFGMIWDHTQPGEQGVVLLVGILFQHIKELEQQFGNTSALIANGSKALGDIRRVEILKALAKEPLCNLELASLLNLSAATVTHHMSPLLREGFVTTSRQGNRVNYSLHIEKLQLLAESIRAIHP